MPDSRRNRIVINLDPNQARPSASLRKKRRWPKVLSILAFLLLVVVIAGAVGAFFWWQHYKGTPAYSLAVLSDAVQRNDAATVDRMMNTDRIVSGMSGQVTERAAARYGTGLSAPEKQRLTALIPSLMPRVKSYVKDELAKSVAAIAEKSKQKPFIVVALALPYAVKITTNGDQALVQVPDLPTILTLEKSEGRWIVVGMKDDKMVEGIVDQLAQDLPAIGQPLDDAAKRAQSGSRRKRKRR